MAHGGLHRTAMRLVKGMDDLSHGTLSFIHSLLQAYSTIQRLMPEIDTEQARDLILGNWERDL